MFATVAESLGVIGSAHVMFDSVMGVLGTKDSEQVIAVAKIVDEAEHLELTGLMTHFATAVYLSDDYLDRQLETFTALVERFRWAYPDLIVYAANSAATFREAAAHFDMVRCGVADCGLDPLQEDAAEWGLERAITLCSYVAAVRRFEVGDSAGYGRAWSTSPRLSAPAGSGTATAGVANSRTTVTF